MDADEPADEVHGHELHLPRVPRRPQLFQQPFGELLGVMNQMQRIRAEPVRAAGDEWRRLEVRALTVPLTLGPSPRTAPVFARERAVASAVPFVCPSS